MKTPNVHLLARVAMFAAITGALAFAAIPLPFSPVPVTGQSLGTMLAGLLLGARDGALSQVVYAFLGAIGLPVFAGGTSGLGVLAGPTGGYVIGAAVEAVEARAKGKPASIALSVVACIAGGVLVVYALGVAQLATVAGLPLSQAVLVGALPFIPGDLLKAFVAGVVGHKLRAALRWPPRSSRRPSLRNSGTLLR